MPRMVLLNLKRRAKMGKIRKEEVMEMKTQLEKVKFWKKRKKKEMKMEKKGMRMVKAAVKSRML